MHSTVIPLIHLHRNEENKMVLNLKSVVLFEVYDIYFFFCVCVCHGSCLSPVLCGYQVVGMFTSRGMRFIITVESRFTIRLTCRTPMRTCCWSSSVKSSLSRASTRYAPKNSWVTQTLRRNALLSVEMQFSLLSINVMIGPSISVQTFTPIALKNIIYFFLCVCLSRLHCVQRPPQSQWSAGSAFHHPV